MKQIIKLNKTDHVNFVKLLMPDVMKAYNRHSKLADKMNKALDNYLTDTNSWFIHPKWKEKYEEERRT